MEEVWRHTKVSMWEILSQVYVGNIPFNDMHWAAQGIVIFMTVVGVVGLFISVYFAGKELDKRREIKNERDRQQRKEWDKEYQRKERLRKEEAECLAKQQRYHELERAEQAEKHRIAEHQRKLELLEAQNRVIVIYREEEE